MGDLQIPSSLAAQDAEQAAYKAYLRNDTIAVTYANRAVALDTGWTAAYASRAFWAAHLMRIVRPGSADSALEAARQRYERIGPLSRALVDDAAAVATGDAAGFLAAAQQFPPSRPLRRRDAIWLPPPA